MDNIDEFAWNLGNDETLFNIYFTIKYMNEKYYCLLDENNKLFNVLCDYYGNCYCTLEEANVRFGTYNISYEEAAKCGNLRLIKWLYEEKYNNVEDSCDIIIPTAIFHRQFESTNKYKYNKVIEYALSKEYKIESNNYGYISKNDIDFLRWLMERDIHQTYKDTAIICYILAEIDDIELFNEFYQKGCGVNYRVIQNAYIYNNMKLLKYICNNDEQTYELLVDSLKSKNNIINQLELIDKKFLIMPEYDKTCGGGIVNLINNGLQDLILQ